MIKLWFLTKTKKDLCEKSCLKGTFNFFNLVKLEDLAMPNLLNKNKSENNFANAKTTSQNLPSLCRNFVHTTDFQIDYSFCIQIFAF